MQSDSDYAHAENVLGLDLFLSMNGTISRVYYHQPINERSVASEDLS